jgi:hypothetical protein
MYAYKIIFAKILRPVYNLCEIDSKNKTEFLFTTVTSFWFKSDKINVSNLLKDNRC